MLQEFDRLPSFLSVAFPRAVPTPTALPARHHSTATTSCRKSHALDMELPDASGPATPSSSPLMQDAAKVRSADKRRCRHPDCTMQSSFNVEGESERLYCASHKRPGMVGMGSKRCTHDGCQKSPAFNIEGESRGIFCASHKHSGMTNVVSKRCEDADCRIQAKYNNKGVSRGRFCAAHKQPGMVNVMSKNCEHSDCGTQARFNTMGLRGGDIVCFTSSLPWWMS